MSHWKDRKLSDSSRSVEKANRDLFYRCGEQSQTSGLEQNDHSPVSDRFGSIPIGLSFRTGLPWIAYHHSPPTRRAVSSRLLGRNPTFTGSLPSRLRLRRLGQAEVVGSPATFNLFTPAQIAENRLAGRREVIGDPTAYGLFTAPRADLRLDGLVLPISTNALVNFKLQSSDDLKRWVDTVVITNVPVDLTVPTRFFRFRAE